MSSTVDQGAGVLPVPMMHALEALSYVLGDFSTAAAVRRPLVHTIEDGNSVTATAFDHVAIAGHLQNGAIASVLFRGAPSRGDNLRWEINGTEGDLVPTAANGSIQVADLKLEGGGSEQTTVASIELPATFAAAPGGLSADFGNMRRSFATYGKAPSSCWTLLTL
jgi:predicted dehydrogenase